MKHKNMNDPSTWYGNGHIEFRNSQIEVIKKHYSDYDENDWVLWIIPDLFYKFKADITGTIKIFLKNEETLEVPYLTRSPYPNKWLKQMSMKSGRKRLYGIPLLFKTFEELCEISRIEIRWSIVETDRLPFSEVTDLIVNYNLNFKKNSENPEYRFFTVYSQDTTYFNFSDNEEDTIKANKYYDEFDIALLTRGEFDKHKKEINLFDAGTEPNIISLKPISTPCNDYEIENITENFMNLLNLKRDYNLICNLLEQSKIKGYYQWVGFYQEKAETLKACYMADIIGVF